MPHYTFAVQWSRRIMSYSHWSWSIAMWNCLTSTLEVWAFLFIYSLNHILKAYCWIFILCQCQSGLALFHTLMLSCKVIPNYTNVAALCHILWALCCGTHDWRLVAIGALHHLGKTGFKLVPYQMSLKSDRLLCCD